MASSRLCVKSYTLAGLYLSSIVVAVYCMRVVWQTDASRSVLWVAYFAMHALASVGGVVCHCVGEFDRYQATSEQESQHRDTADEVRQQQQQNEADRLEQRHEAARLEHQCKQRTKSTATATATTVAEAEATTTPIVVPISPPSPADKINHSKHQTLGMVFFVVRLATRVFGTTALNFALFDLFGIARLFDALDLSWIEFRAAWLMIGLCMMAADLYLHECERREDFVKTFEVITFVNLLLVLYVMRSAEKRLRVWYHLGMTMALLFTRFHLHAEGDYCHDYYCTNASILRASVPVASLQPPMQIVRIMLLNVAMVELAYLFYYFVST
jgi:hypothetical protein